jgi:hypothetical protein
MRDQEIVGIWEAYTKIYEQDQSESVEQVDNYDEILEYLLSEGYSKEESDQIMVELINENRLGALIKGVGAVAKFVAGRAKTPLRTAATDSLITSTALNPVSTAKVAKTIAKSAPTPAPIVRTVKSPAARTAPKGANKITTNVWNEPTAPSSRINPSKPSGTKVSSTKALSGTPSRPALPSAGKTSASVKAPKPTFKPEALPKTNPTAEPPGALVSTKKPKPTFKPEALPKATKSAEPPGALVSTKKPKPTFKPEALPKATKSAEPGGALVRTKAPKPTFKPEALPKATKSAEPGGALVRTKAPKPTFKPEALPKTNPTAEPPGALVSTKKPKPSSKTPSSTSQSSSGGTGSNKERYTQIGQEYKNRAQARRSERAQKSAQANSGRLATAGAVGAIGASTVAGMGLSQNKKSEKVTPNVYNTMDKPSIDKPTGQIRSRLAVGPRKIGSTFDDAFREAKRKEREAKRIGDSVPTTFTYGGKEYSTKMKEENLINYLLDEGFASDEKSAEAILGAMSEAWIDSIVEAKIEPPKEKVGALINIDIPQNEREAARQRTLAKAKKMREKRENKD